MKKQFEVIIIGGSFAGLSAGLTLGRSLTPTLIIDSGEPCNAPTPHAHNLITHDGKVPGEIAHLGKKDLEKYDHVEFINNRVVHIEQKEDQFLILTDTDEEYFAEQIIFATGVKDLLPETKGFKECWGKTIIHCPYCHGYEAKNTKTGILAKGEQAFEKAKMIFHWTKDLTIFTNGPHEMTAEQLEILSKKNISVLEKEIKSYLHDEGKLEALEFMDNTRMELDHLYALLPTAQPNSLAIDLGIEISESGHIVTNEFQTTSQPKILAAGDGTTPMRSLSQAIAQGNIAGVVANRTYIQNKYDFE
ncbi:Thioredoxin reductase [Lishizhenia tianjinensis]|uniref:Thioredoxin reductase n=1 Tax=Lishizhenia tianjinensis TaxID=477690 RepID=A0A1I6XHI0_9FLAO|nr:NAD(P)/FAD-dependent oxidoreductase [Lishizhenia tianjinensis]SFT37501.1 Thioredoxin reductase [Lishizhenia tianjinensis]